MEAVGAAGAIIGLAGSALAGLKSLGELIAVLQDGKIDLDTTQQRLVEHEFRLSELRAEYDSLPTGFIIPEEKVLLDECIKGSHEEVKRYKKLLEKAARTRAQRKGFQKVETAVKMYLHGEDFKKHRSMLQDRTLRLQGFSERFHRVRTTASFQSVMSSATQRHAEEMAAHTRTANTLQAVSDNLEKSLQESLITSSAFEAHVTAIVGSYNQQTQTLIEASQLSTVKELKESMRHNILPMIQDFFDAAQNSGVDLRGRNQRGTWSQHQGHNRLCADTHRDSRNVVRTVYRTPLGRLHVAYSRKDAAAENFNAAKHGAAYWIKFDPYRLFSKGFVEWRLFLNTGCTGPPTTIWCNVGTLCEDIEVIDALGLIPEYYNCSHETIAAGGYVRHSRACRFSWRTKLPDPRRLRRLLEGRQFSPGDSMRHFRGAIRKILTVFVQCHHLCENPERLLDSKRVYFYDRKFCCREAYKLIVNGQLDYGEPVIIDDIIQKSRAEYEYLSRFYPAYYDTLKLLLEIGCEPDDWDDLMSDVASNTFHVIESHTRYASTDFFRLHSPIKLVRTAAKRSFITEWFRPAAFSYVPREINSDGSVFSWTFTGEFATHIGNLLPHENLFHELEETIFDMGGANALHRGFQYDRWLLVLMSYMQPRLRTLVASDAGKCRDSNFIDFSIEKVIEEIETTLGHEKDRVAEYLVFNGSLSLLQLVTEKGFDPSALLSPAGRRGSPEIMDYVLQSCLKQERCFQSLDFIHHPYIKLRISQDPVFRTQLLDLLISEARRNSHEFHHFDGALFELSADAFLVSDMIIGHLMLAEPAEPPEYIREVVNGCLSRYSKEGFCFVGGIRLYIICGLRVQHSYQKHSNTDHTACEDLGRATSAFHQILQQLLSSSAFGCGLEHVPNDKQYDLEPGTEAYTPLMLALHGGMIPAVKILVEAGAAIRDSTTCRRSALQLAEKNAHSNHPRVCWTKFRPWAETREPQYVSLSADEEMLQILRNALHSRGEEALDPCLSKQDFAKPMLPLVLAISWKVLEQIEIFSYWLFSPTVHISVEDVGERLGYVAVVFTIAFLSIAQLLRLKIDDNVLGGLLKLLSRPVVMIPVAAYIIRALWRHYCVGSEGSAGLPR